MFSTSTSKLMAAWAVAGTMMMLMMMMTEAAAVPKESSHSGKSAARTHRKSSGATVETVPLQLDPKNFPAPKNMRPLENSSISPWTYNFTRNDSVFPPVLAEARCLLQGCLDSEGLEDMNLRSRPIMHQVLVLRRVRSEGAGHSYHYRLESRLIAVGCTCVRPVIQHQH